MPDNIRKPTAEANPFAAAAEPDRMHRYGHAALAERIERDIRDHHLRRGTQLEMEVTLPARYCVDIATVTDAVAALATTGLLERQPYGPLIIDKPVQWLLECSGVRFPTVIEQFEMRTLVAPACAELAGLNAADPDLAELESLSERMSARAAAGEPAFEDEREFNLALAGISGNPFLIAQSRQLWHLIESHTWRIIRAVEGPAEWAETAADYAAIAYAVAGAQGFAASHAMRSHLSHLDRRYFRGRAVDGGTGT